jgi:hypothetical protein
MRRSLLASGLVMLALSVLPSTTSASDPVRVDLQIVDHGRPVAAADVVIYLSCDRVAGVTDDHGNVALQSDCGGRVFWVEINSQRVSELFRVESAARTIDLAAVTYIEWQGGR